MTIETPDNNEFMTPEYVDDLQGSHRWLLKAAKDYRDNATQKTAESLDAAIAHAEEIES